MVLCIYLFIRIAIFCAMGPQPIPHTYNILINNIRISHWFIHVSTCVTGHSTTIYFLLHPPVFFTHFSPSLTVYLHDILSKRFCALFFFFLQATKSRNQTNGISIFAQQMKRGMKNKLDGKLELWFRQKQHSRNGPLQIPNSTTKTKKERKKNVQSRMAKETENTKAPLMKSKTKMNRKIILCTGKKQKIV